MVENLKDIREWQNPGIIREKGVSEYGSPAFVEFATSHFLMGLTVKYGERLMGVFSSSWGCVSPSC